MSSRQNNSEEEITKVEEGLYTVGDKDQESAFLSVSIITLMQKVHFDSFLYANLWI